MTPSGEEATSPSASRSKANDTPRAGTVDLPSSLSRSAKSTSPSSLPRGGVQSDARAMTAHQHQYQEGSSSNDNDTDSPSSATSPRPLFHRLSTLPDQHVLNSAHTKNRPMNQWTIPKQAKGTRAATLFLGKDYERWQVYERESMGGGLKLAWSKRPGSSSDIHYSTSGAGPSSAGSSAEDDDDEMYSDAFTTDGESESSMGAASGKSSRRSSRSGRSRSGSGVMRRPGILGNNLQPLSSSQVDLRRGSVDDAASSPSSSLHDSSSQRRRRFSSNGPDAAFLRHSTVMGLHTPRRDSASESGPPSPMSKQQLSQGLDRIAIAPLSQIKPPSGRPSKMDVPPAGAESATPSQDAALKKAVSSIGKGAKRSSKRMHREVSSSDLLKKAAAAAAASIEQSSASESERDDASTSSVLHSDSSSPVSGSISPRPAALRLARRRKPISVEGTLYDRSGPFREGAVTDGLSVRLFSTEHVGEDHGFDDEEHATNGQEGEPDARKSRASRRTHREEDSQQGGTTNGEGSHSNGSTDSDVKSSHRDLSTAPPPPATTYLITTPDNRVSSAAKLRRWAMDGAGRFYAAMEIKSVEAKVRSATETTAPSGSTSGSAAAYARSLAKILRQTYLDDILNEVQKAETLNPGRNSVARLLVTSDGKYVRLEEDYPEEAFFVIAGCEEEELYPVAALVFCQTLRHIHRFHSSGWMHGDIKLENLMFDSQGSLVVIDYENANPFRIPGGDGCVSLMSFDWVPPEAKPGPNGRRAGPSADLWALGANLVRAFALRDGVEDGAIREMLLEGGQEEFLRYRDGLVTKGVAAKKANHDGSAGKTRDQGGDDSLDWDESATGAGRVTAEDIDLGDLLEDPTVDAAAAAMTPQQSEQGFSHSNGHSQPSKSGRTSSISPRRLLTSFAHCAPHLLRYVLASCLTLDPTARGVDAELEGLRLAAQLEAENGGETMRIAKVAVDTAIRLSGSEWVRPKLDEARINLGLE
ncbi:hypothetical protein BDZ90DRAFT_137499 [Jaminaea rosea]|uniref:Protein kinase domain-containing protein n=1 Tax=Jaminaea rosea TaxID=1569628 RepID=A0A316UXL1_9BASI|nr:hypothetical protein BDZ90DRAFT_137499 [Jaminaea rosea]PWN29031.1 hypothetical protein BDZ90DRAFT_137499 [Jaminaea rosea]